jgi:energy-coupling factor transport system ATP-binding protein
VIDFTDVTVTYAGARRPALAHVSFHLSEGEFALVAGRTGSGKSTLLGAVNGHVPHFTGGRLGGRVEVAGCDTRDHPPRELAQTVGVVRQDPLSGFVADTVEEELAYGMEQLGFAPAVMRTRVEETLDLLGIAPLRARALRSLSGGQQQRVAIGSVLAAGARVLVLDEPTSALDPTSAEEVLATLLRLVHDLGTTVLIAEHRLERVIEYADRLLLVQPGGAVENGPPADLIARSPLRPPVADLGRLAGWSPLPLSVRAARRLAGPLRQRLAGCDPDAYPRRSSPPVSAVETIAAAPVSMASAVPSSGPTGLRAEHIGVVYGRTVAVRDATFELTAGQITFLMGRNGSGKSSLLWALSGAGPCYSGRWSVGGRDLSAAPLDKVREAIRLVPQNAADLLYLDSVGAECAAADRAQGSPPGTAKRSLDRLAPGLDLASHPRDLSEGQRLCLVLALQVAAGPPVLLLDEPTRGLDDAAKSALAASLAGLARKGRTLAVATHDVEFAARLADRVLVMAAGDLIADGPPAEILGRSSAMAPQTAKVLSPQPWLTVCQVAAALEDL